MYPPKMSETLIFRSNSKPVISIQQSFKLTGIVLLVLRQPVPFHLDLYFRSRFHLRQRHRKLSLTTVTWLSSGAKGSEFGSDFEWAREFGVEGERRQDPIRRRRFFEFVESRWADLPSFCVTAGVVSFKLHLVVVGGRRNS